MKKKLVFLIQRGWRFYKKVVIKSGDKEIIPGYISDKKVSNFLFIKYIL